MQVSFHEKKRLPDVFWHPKRDASLLSTHQKALQHEVVVLEAVLHEMFELLVLRIVGGLRDPHTMQKRIDSIVSILPFAFR